VGKEDAEPHAPALAANGRRLTADGHSPFAVSRDPSGAGSQPGVPLRFLQFVVGSVVGTGYIPIAPATFASLAAIVLIRLLPRAILPYSLFTVVLFVAGGLLAGSMERRWGSDARYITVDELVGMLVTMFLVPLSIWSAALGFLLFRFFDIVKPLFIRAAERIPDGWGVMADDVVAGICANFVLQVVFRLAWHTHALQWSA
jgi:phosphatidylglycerophosphatase A